MNIPQVLGYARIAGMPVVTGLYTVSLPLVAFAVFGSSRHLADSATAVIFSSSLSGMAVPATDKYVALVGMVALLTAGILFLAWIFKQGFLADFLSRTVLVGFLTGVGVQVGIAMLSDIFGVTVGSHRTLGQASEILQALPRSNLAAVILSVLVAGSILIGNRVAPRLPISLFAVVGSIAASAAFRFAERGIAVIGPVPGGAAAYSTTRRDLERSPRAAAGGRFMLRDDNGAKRSDVARIRAALSRTRRRGRRHPRAVGCECSRRVERDVRGQR
jgi:MFS superfamily sulfate permease-like transporter